MPLPDSKSGKIRAAALSLFASRGVVSTSMREVAVAAGVSVGLIQHHFGTKAGLVAAVDDHVAELFRNILASGPGAVSIDDFGEQMTALLVEHTRAVDYLARALVDDTAFGSSLFASLVKMGVQRWDGRARDGLTHPGLDNTWASLNLLLLFFSTVLLRPHVDRVLGDPLLAPAELMRWGTAVKDLMRHGLLQ